MIEFLRLIGAPFALGWRIQNDDPQPELGPTSILICFSAEVNWRVPGYKVTRFESKRLFFHLYWKLLVRGYTEQQIADLAVTWGHRSRVPPEIAMVLAVFDLADYRGLVAAEPFVPALDAA